MARQFDPETDVGILRDCLKKLLRLEGKKLAPFAEELSAYCNKVKGPDGKPARRAIPRTSLQDYLDSDSPAFRNMGYLRGLWEYIAQHQDYRRYLPDAARQENSPETRTPPHEALSAALAGCFIERQGVRHLRAIGAMIEQLTGNYVMYRADLRGVKAGLPYDGTINASRVEIFSEEKTLRIREIQDFGMTKRYGKIDQHNEGVIFTYGRYLIALMDARKGTSFKCMALKEFSEYAGEAKITFFQGAIFVASEQTLYPSSKFFCRRIEDTAAFGLFRPDEIDDELAKAYLATPTYPSVSIIS